MSAIAKPNQELVIPRRAFLRALPFVAGAAHAAVIINPFRFAVGGGSEVLGDQTGGSGSSISANYLYCAKGPFTPTHNGTVTTISLYSSNTDANLDIKLGLYTDSSGSPSALVSGSPAAFTNVGSTWTTEWHDFTVSIPVVAGTTYWPAWDVSGAGFTVNNNTLADYWKYRSLSYASAWPNPAATTSSSTRAWCVKITNTW